MSSDTYYIEVRSIEGDTVELLCTTSGAGDVNDFAVTRSFALIAIRDGMNDEAPLSQALVEVARDDTPPVWEEEFHRDHVEKFIASTELLERIGIIEDERAWYDGRRGIRSEARAEREYPRHRFVLRVRMTEPRFLEGLTVGDKYGTTAFDAWGDDPVCPTRAQVAAVDKKASRWTKPDQKNAGKETAAKKPAKKGGK